MSDQGENGPLDVQMRGKDELIASESGLTSTTALDTLNERVYEAFENFLLKITRGAGPTISTRTITDIAVKLTCGTFSHIYQQVDPKNIVAAERALKIAKAYGFRLVSTSQNLISTPEDALEHLISHYPSHGFIIDLGEAKKIFRNVREFSTDENALMRLLGSKGRWPVEQEQDYITTFISKEIPAIKTNASKAKQTGGQKNVKRQKSGPANKPATGTADTAAIAGTSPSVITQLPTVQGIVKRHA
jgi:hypothetical protein